MDLKNALTFSKAKSVGHQACLHGLAHSRSHSPSAGWIGEADFAIGRLLVALLLEHWGLLKVPLLYLSLFFKRHRDEYYRRLNHVRLEGDWEGWIDFFLDGISTISDEAVASARELFNLVSTDRTRLLGVVAASVSALRLFEQLPRHPIVTVALAMKMIDASKPTAARAIDVLLEIDILVETTGKKRDRHFAYRAYVDLLRTGTDFDTSR